MVSGKRIAQSARLALLCAGPAAVLWLGQDSLGEIQRLYDGLCESQGPGMAHRLYDGDPQGYCTGIGSDLYLLHIIVWLAAITLPIAVLAWRRFSARQRIE